MASISKLSIRGIRSFSPDDEEQVIGFCFPLTILVGMNGCGKTTVIESLKYAVTGSLPPGNKSGQAFVHDPKSVSQSTVKGQIKLRFTNRAGNSMVVIRSVEVQQKKTTMSFKALDGILRTTDPTTGERVSMSHKCTELDRQIPNLMGVSKPILEHVVFCHQEDSSWPLMEGAVLKKRFDDIFDSTRYAKALEAITKSRKEYANVTKELKADLAGLSSHKHAAEGFKDELEQTRDELSRIDDEIGDYNAKIAENHEERKKHQKVLNQREELGGRIDDKQAELDQVQVKFATQQSMLGDKDLTEKHSKDELETMLTGFDETSSERERELRSKRDEVDRVKADIERLRSKTMELNAAKGKLEAEHEAHERLLRERNHKMQSIHEKHNVDLISQTQETFGTGMGTQQSAISALTGRTSLGSVTTVGGAGQSQGSQDSIGGVTVSAEDMAAFQRALDGREKSLREELNDHKTQSQREEDELQNEISELQAKLRSIESEISRIQGEERKARSELNELSQKSSQSVRMRQSEIDGLKQRARKLVSEREEATKDPRRDAIPRDMKTHEEKVRRLQLDIEDDNSALKLLRRTADEQSAIDILAMQCTQEIEIMEETMRENSFLLQKHNVNARITREEDENIAQPIEEMAAFVKGKHTDAKEDLDRATDRRDSLQHSITQKKTLLEHNQARLNRLKTQAERLSSENSGAQRIKRTTNALRKFEVSQYMDTDVKSDADPNDLLKHMTTRIGELSIDEDKPESVSRVVKKLKKMSKIVDETTGEEEKFKCPCCDRDMNSEEVFVFVEKMKELADPESSELVQQGKKDADKNAAARRNYETWRNTVSESINEYLDFKRVSAEIDDMEGKVKEEESQLEELQKELNAKEEAVKENREEYNDLDTLLGVATRLRSDANKVAEKQREIQSKRDTLVGDSQFTAGGVGGRDLRTVERDLEAHNKEKDELQSAITKLNKELSEINNNISNVSNQATKAEQRVREAEEQYASYQAASKKREELNKSLGTYENNRRQLEKEVAPLRQSAAEKNIEKNRIRQHSQRKEGDLRSVLSSFREDVSALHRLTQQIQQYLGSNKAGELEGIQSKLSAVAENTGEKEAQLKQLLPELAQCERKVKENDSLKKQIQENFNLLETKAIMRERENELDVLQDELDTMTEGDTSNEDLKACGIRINDYTEKKAKLEGRKMGLKDQQLSLRRKLKTEEYHNIEERHRVTMIKHVTTETTVRDLEKYHSALDKALLRYHGLKIRDINKIIKELWTLTYKGEDITNIELVSGQETGSRANRSYNYRVLMSKGSTKMDMRGRCSAGQRVLASIVIRLALAETFCLNCGVMALDEPTTNLDFSNKQGLAVALAQIIANRAAQQNFQLIVITHDEEFVTMMKQELSAQTGFDMPERYYQIRREEGHDGKYYSKIHAIDWDEI